MRTTRLTVADRALARELFTLLSRVFDEPPAPLSDGYLDRLLTRGDFWALAALDGDDAPGGCRVIGGLTAHTLPMTRAETSEIFLYDLAVHPDHQRRGVGRRLIADLRARAAALGIHDLFVPADDEDTHALDFYRALGATPSPVTFFSFTR